MTYLRKPFCSERIQAALNKSLRFTRVVSSYKSAQEVNALELVQDLLNNPEDQVILATLRAKALERYTILPGKVFATDAKAKEKYKILRLIANDVVYKDLGTGDVRTEEINSLLLKWNRKGLKEISFLTEVLGVVKQVLGPLLGVFLTSVLINWLIKKL